MMINSGNLTAYGSVVVQGDRRVIVTPLQPATAIAVSLKFYLKPTCGDFLMLDHRLNNLSSVIV